MTISDRTPFHTPTITTQMVQNSALSQIELPFILPPLPPYYPGSFTWLPGMVPPGMAW